MTELAILAEQIGVSDRTLRRAVSEGTLRAARPTPRRLDMPSSERDYARRKWPLLSSLRATLRTEPNVRFALLFGSTATDADTSASEVGVLVDLRDADFERVVDLVAKLEAVVQRHVDGVEFHDAEREPSFLARAVSEGRVLVDREGLWPRLRAAETSLRRRGDRRDAERLRSALAGIDRLLASC